MLGRTRSALLIGSTVAVSLAGLIALYLLFRSGSSLAWIFAVPTLLLPLPYYISHPDFRFWCLLAPSLTMLASWWFSTSLGKLQKRRLASAESF